MESNNVNPNCEKVVAINLKLLSFLKIVQIEFNMKFQSFFVSQVLAKLDFPYLSLHLSEWNEKKLFTFIKVYIIRYNFVVFLKKLIRKGLCVALATQIMAEILKNS